MARNRQIAIRFIQRVILLTGGRQRFEQRLVWIDIDSLTKELRNQIAKDEKWNDLDRVILSKNGKDATKLHSTYIFEIIENYQKC